MDLSVRETVAYTASLFADTAPVDVVAPIFKLVDPGMWGEIHTVPGRRSERWGWERGDLVPAPLLT